MLRERGGRRAKAHVSKHRGIDTVRNVADEAGIGAFAAAVAAKQARTKKSKAAPADATPEAVATRVMAAATSTARTFAKKPAKGVERAKITYRQARTKKTKAAAGDTTPEAVSRSGAPPRPSWSR